MVYLPSSLFRQSTDSFVCDASTLDDAAQGGEWTVLVDSTNVGFTMLNCLGFDVLFVEQGIDRNEKNEILAWVFRPSQECIEANKELFAYRAIVVND